MRVFRVRLMSFGSSLDVQLTRDSYRMSIVSSRAQRIQSHGNATARLVPSPAIQLEVSGAKERRGNNGLPSTSRRPRPFMD